LPSDTVVGSGGKASAYDSSSPGGSEEVVIPVYIVRSELIADTGHSVLAATSS